MIQKPHTATQHNMAVVRPEPHQIITDSSFLSGLSEQPSDLIRSEDVVSVWDYNPGFKVE